MPPWAHSLLTEIAGLGHLEYAIRSHILQQLAYTRWPADLDFPHHARFAQTKMNAWIA
jgi:hypothetical protein